MVALKEDCGLMFSNRINCHWSFENLNHWLMTSDFLFPIRTQNSPTQQFFFSEEQFMLHL